MLPSSVLWDSEIMDSGDLLSFIDAFSQQHIVVLGDLMLDRYVWGSASRISQEAPVPVVRVNRRNAVPGGAANVARNVCSLGGNAELVGVVGKDADGDELEKQLTACGIGMGGVQHLDSRQTTVKMRVIAGNQQVVRIDSEDSTPVSANIRRKLRECIEEMLANGKVGGLILEDYAKGVFGRDFMQSIVNCARKNGVLTSLDPHPNDAFNVKGLSLMTPNRSEAFALAGVKYVPGSGLPREDKALLKVAEIIKRRWRPDHLLVTLGAQGMALFSGDFTEPQHIPTRARQVFDVSGAGDTVMATMVLSMLSGASAFDAARIANHAAGVVVGIVGTAAIEADVLRNAIQED